MTPHFSLAKINLKSLLFTLSILSICACKYPKNPNQEAALAYNRGNAELKAQEYKAAIAFYNRALAINPNFEIAYLQSKYCL